MPPDAKDSLGCSQRVSFKTKPHQARHCLQPTRSALHLGMASRMTWAVSQKWKVALGTGLCYNSFLVFVAIKLQICLQPFIHGSRHCWQNCENTRAAWQLFFTARTWAKPHRFDSSVTLLLRRVVQGKTQWHSNVLKLLKLLQKSSQASKTFFQILQIKRLQLKLTNNLQNSYQISSQHQVPKTWVKQHPKTPKTTKTNENPSPSSSMHKLVPFGSKLVPTWFL